METVGGNDVRSHQYGWLNLKHCHLLRASRRMDRKERLKGSDVVLMTAIFEFLSFLLLCSQDEDDDESSWMIQ
jgi:hypothetical protein